MAIEISDLPLKYQRQALTKYTAQQVQRGTRLSKADPLDSGSSQKYHNSPTERVTMDGGVIYFDSRKEARRFDELTRRVTAGQIRDLRLQVDFTLQEAYTDTEGCRIRAIRYRADFTYWEREQETDTWRQIVEDVKSRGTRTKEYLLKRKMMKDRLGIDITEV